MATLPQRSSKEWKKYAITQNLKTVEHFDTLFRRYLRDSQDEEMKQINKEAIDWCSKKRLEIVKELI